MLDTLVFGTGLVPGAAVGLVQCLGGFVCCRRDDSIESPVPNFCPVSFWMGSCPVAVSLPPSPVVPMVLGLCLDPADALPLPSLLPESCCWNFCFPIPIPHKLRRHPWLWHLFCCCCSLCCQCRLKILKLFVQLPFDPLYHLLYRFFPFTLCYHCPCILFVNLLLFIFFRRAKAIPGFAPRFLRRSRLILCWCGYVVCIFEFG